MKKNNFIKLTSIFFALCFVNLFCACSFMQENATTDFSFTLSREVFAGDPAARYKVGCALTGDVNKTQIIYLSEQEKEATFNFAQIQLGAKVNINVKVYDVTVGDVLVYQGQESVVVNAENNFVSLKLEKLPYLKGQGATAKSAITIESKNFEKTAEIVIIPEGSVATIHMTDDSSWNTYLASTEIDQDKGVFIKDRKVQLSPYAISAYEVTQELYEAVMESNPSEFSSTHAEGEVQKYRPVEKVTWCDAVNFCNELTKKTMTDADCVYTIVYLPEVGDGIDSITVEIDIAKKGYRLPTDAEWEFAARGGDPTSPEWKFAYSGVQTKKTPDNFNTEPCNDEELEKYGWFGYFERKYGPDYLNVLQHLEWAGYDELQAEDDFLGTHEVGKKEANKLGLYDMSGNVYEWCYDGWDFTGTDNDEAYKVGDTIKNPLGDPTCIYRVIRGGDWGNSAKWCSISDRCLYYYGEYLSDVYNFSIGFRLARSL